MKITHLARHTFRHRIAEDIRANILSGAFPAGSQLTETGLAERFGSSRGPLREALRQLVEEGLLVTVPYKGTYVAELSVNDIQEIYSFRTMLEIFAFGQVWERRDEAFRTELAQRHQLLSQAIESGDDPLTIRAELDLHGLVYETANHRLLLESWNGLKQKLQLYWATHHRAHERRGPYPDSHDSYVAAASGDNLSAMEDEIRNHMRRGAETTVRFVAGRINTEDNLPDTANQPHDKRK